MVKIIDFRADCVNKVLLIFVIISFVIKDEYAKRFAARVIILFLNQLEYNRLSELRFSCSHCANYASIRMHNLFSIVRIPID